MFDRTSGSDLGFFKLSHDNCTSVCLTNRFFPTRLAGITGLLRSGVLADGQHLALVTQRGKILRIDPPAVNPQGAAGNGVARVKLDAGDPV